MLNNITKTQERFLWIMLIPVVISIFINKEIMIMFSIIFIVCFLIVEEWSSTHHKNKWKYHECKTCYVLWPHLVVPEICVCGNDMKKNYNEKELIILSFKDCSQNVQDANNKGDLE